MTSNHPPVGPGEVRLHLVRHGQTVWNAASKLAGCTDVELTELGRAQAASLRPRLGVMDFDRVWSSDLQRAVHTAQLAYGEPVQDPRLRELDFGDLEGELWLELAERYREPLKSFAGFAAPGGESLEDLGVRLRSFAESLEPGRHLVFTHGGVIRWFMHGLTDDVFVQNGTLVTVRWHPNPEVIEVNPL